MEDKWKQLDLRVNKLQQLNDQLLARVCELEDAQEHLTDQIQKLNAKVPCQLIKNQLLEKEMALLKNKQPEEVEESWLFYCEKKRSLESIKKTLQVDSNLVREFDFASWENESIMWRQILQFITNEQFKDADKLTHPQIKGLGIQNLKKHLQDEILFVVRNLPAQTNKLYCLIELCETITQLWNEIELDDESEGRLLLVLESEVNLDKLELIRQDDQKIILQIEKLQHN